jgi:hypothetical protein
MPRTARSTPARGRILAVAGAAAALTAAGTAAAASATAATTPATPAATAAVTTAAVRVPAPGLAGGLTINAPRHVLTTTAGASPLAPASTAATPTTTPAATASGSGGSGGHGTAVTTTTAAKNTTARHTTGHRATAARHARRHGPAGPYQMYDSVTPSAIPAGKPAATYADGPYAATPASVAGHHVTWIDTNGTDPAGATVLDVEPGDATPAAAATWAHQRLNTHPHATAVIYTMRSEWTAAQTSIATLPHWQQHHIRWWIADPTGTPHLVPGSNATQWYWGTHYDISTVNPNF